MEGGEGVRGGSVAERKGHKEKWRREHGEREMGEKQRNGKWGGEEPMKEREGNKECGRGKHGKRKRGREDREREDGRTGGQPASMHSRFCLRPSSPQCGETGARMAATVAIPRFRVQAAAPHRQCLAQGRRQARSGVANPALGSKELGGDCRPLAQASPECHRIMGWLSLCIVVESLWAYNENG